MITAKKIGVWMNHSNSHIMKKISDPIEKKWRNNLIERKKRTFAKNEVFIYNIF